MEYANTRIGILRLAFDAHINIEGLLGLEVGIACPPPAHLRDADADGVTAVHLPVVPKFAHARLRVARTDIRLEAAVRIACDIVRDAEVARDVCTEEAAVIKAQNRREDRILRHLPGIANKQIVALNRAATDGNALVAIPIFFEEHFPIQSRRILIILIRTIYSLFKIVADNIPPQIRCSPMTLPIFIFQLSFQIVVIIEQISTRYVLDIILTNIKFIVECFIIHFLFKHTTLELIFCEILIGNCRLFRPVSILIIVVLIFFLPHGSTGVLLRKGIIMDMRPNIVFVIFSTRESVLLINK